MENGYYIDTSIWIDLYEDRIGYNGEPLGRYALRLFSTIRVKKIKLFISDLLITELESNYSIAEIRGMVLPFEKIICQIYSNREQCKEAIRIVVERNVPYGDALHAIIARDNNLKLITRDKHFIQLLDVSEPYKPEEII